MIDGYETACNRLVKTQDSKAKAVLLDLDALLADLDFDLDNASEDIMEQDLADLLEGL